MSELAERARKLAANIPIGQSIQDAERRLEIKHKLFCDILELLLAERRLAMELALSLAERERIEDVSAEDEAYNTAIEHVKMALRAAAEKEVAK